MNRTFGSVILSVFLMFCTASCSSGSSGTAVTDSDEAEAAAVVDSYLTGLEKGNIEESRKYISENSESMELSDQYSEHVSSLKEQFSAFVGDDESTKDQYEKLIGRITLLSYSGHEMGPAEKISDTEYTVEAKITGVDQDSLNQKVSSLRDVLSENVLTDENKEELNAIYEEQGQHAMETKMISMILDYLNGHFDELFGDTVRTSQSIIFTVRKENDAWKIASAKSK